MANKIGECLAKDFVCSFDMLSALQSTLNIFKIRRLISKLEEDIDDTTKSQDETVYLNNFLTVLFFLNDDIENSLKHCRISLSIDSTNLTAFANRCRIYLETDEITKAEDTFKVLTELKSKADYKDKELAAKAGLAYGYGRAGPKHHQKSVDLYEEVLKQKPNTPHWSFGLALALQRQLHFLHAVGKSKYNKIDTLEKAAHLFYKVATGSAEDLLRGKSWARLGIVLYEIERNVVYAEIKLHQNVKKLKSKDCLEKAYKLCPSEPFVLENCGKFYRYFNLLEESEQFLRHAIKLHPTVFSYHHLALTLKRKVEHSKRHSVPSMSTTGSNENLQNTDRGSGQCRGRNMDQEMGRRSRSYGRRLGQDNSTKMEGHSYSRRLVKSPPEVVKVPGHDLLSEALELLQKAYDLSHQTAVFMLYEKALIYRMIGDNKEAISSLKRIALKSKNDIEGPEILVNVYEQQGYCLLEMIKSGESCEPLNDKKDVMNFFSKAIELQAGILKSAPELKGAWSSFKTVQDLYEGGTAEDKKKLARLHQLLDHHSECIRLYEEEDVNTSMTGRDYCRKARSHMAQDKYDAAIYDLFKATQFTEEVNAIEEDLYRQVYFGGAVQAYKKKEIALAHTRFREMYTKMQRTPVGSDDKSWDQGEDCHLGLQLIHFCAKKDQCKFAYDVSELLKTYTGMNVTVNPDHCLPCHKQVAGILEVMESVPKIVILLHRDDMCPKQDYHIELVLNAKHEQEQEKIVVMSEPGTEVPQKLSIPSIPHITCPVDLDILDTMTSEHEQFLKDLYAQVITLS